MRGLPYDVKALVEKARETALLAVETYNRPTASFRSGAYVVLMIIAWTSLSEDVCSTTRSLAVDGIAWCWSWATRTGPAMTPCWLSSGHLNLLSSQIPRPENERRPRLEDR